MRARSFFSLLMCLGVALAFPREGIAAEDAYVHGYADAVLASRYEDKKITVLSVQDGQVLLAVPGCLTEADRASVELSLLAGGQVKSVAWNEFAQCETPAVAVAVPAPDAEAVIEPLPPYQIFAPLLADPRQPQFSMRYQRYDSAVAEFNAAMVSFGEYFGFASGLWRDASISQIGLQGAVFGLFNLDAASFDLVNADYWIGIPLSYRRGSWSVLTRLYHQSSHLGDEFLLGNPGINRINLSYEDLEVLVSLDLNSVRIYGGGGYILHSEPSLKRGHIQGGIEGRKRHLVSDLDLVAAVDLQSRDEHGWWRWSRSFQAGFAFNRLSGREVRLMLEHFNGFSPNGQFYRDRLRYTGLGIYFGF